jgi:hypothetical protein
MKAKLQTIRDKPMPDEQYNSLEYWRGCYNRCADLAGKLLILGRIRKIQWEQKNDTTKP